MSAWETLGTHGDEPAYIEEFGELWRASDKVVYSTTLGSVCAARTRIERAFEPDAVRRMKDELVGDISIGGPTLAAQAIAAGLVDEYQLFVVPVVVGGGTRCLAGWNPARLAARRPTPVRQRHGVRELSPGRMTAGPGVSRGRLTSASSRTPEGRISKRGVWASAHAQHVRCIEKIGGWHC